MSMAAVPPTRQSPSRGSAAARRWRARSAAPRAKTTTATGCSLRWRARTSIPALASGSTDFRPALSAIFVDARGDRTIVTYRDKSIASVAPRDPETVAAAADLVLADNRYPQFVRPICEAARRRNLRVVLDADKATAVDDPLFRIATHVVFSTECLSAATGRSDLAEGLKQIAQHTHAFLAVSNGPDDILYLEGGSRAPRAGFRDSRGRYAWRRRRLAWRVCAGACRRTKRAGGFALWRCCRRSSNAAALAAPPVCRAGRSRGVCGENVAPAAERFSIQALALEFFSM